MEADSGKGMEWDYPLHAFFDERRADMSSAFEDMNMEVCMEEAPFEEAGLPAGNPGKGENGLPDGFMDSTDAFGENPFDSDGQEQDAAYLPAQEETVSDGAWEDAEESAGPETDGAEETGEPEEEGEPAETGKPNEAGEPAEASEPEKEESPDAQEESEDKKRAEHEASEARRKAEWEARQQAKRDAEKAQMERIMAMSEEELMSESMKRVGTDTEKLTRRNMKECVSEYIQTACLEDAAFARQVMLPQKNMVRCFQYINRKAYEYVQDEMKAAGIQPGRDTPCYSSDIPDDLCYHWAEEYFRTMDVKEDKEDEEKFVPKPYAGRTTAGSKGKKTTAKKSPAKKPAEKKAEKKEPADNGQISFMEQLSLESMLAPEKKAG